MSCADNGATSDMAATKQPSPNHSMETGDSYVNSHLSTAVQAWLGSHNLEDHMQLIRGVDWASKGPLEPMALWPPEILFLVQAMTLDPEPRMLLLGTKEQMLYNPAYADLIGDAHPEFLGSPIKDLFVSVELREILDQSFKSAQTGPYTHRNIVYNVLEKGVLLERVVNWKLSKLTGSIPGYYAALTDQTDIYDQDLRRAGVQSMSRAWDAATNLDTLWNLVTQSISDRPYHFPFALLYTSNTGIEPDDLSRLSDGLPSLSLHASVGQFDHASLPSNLLNLRTFNTPNAQKLLDAVKSKQLVSFTSPETGMLGLPESWFAASSSRGHGDPCKAAAIHSLRSSRSHKIYGILIMGLGTRKLVTKSYQNCVTEFNRMFNEKIALALFNEEENRKRQEEAQRIQTAQALLAKELAIRERESWLAIGQVQRMLKIMDISDVGAWECNTSGKLIQANDAWYKQSGFPRNLDECPEFSWITCVHEDDRERVLGGWDKVRRLESVSYEMRWNKIGQDNKPESEELWVLSVCVPVTDENGILTSISGCTTNITAQKRSEQDKERRIEALEQARLSEQRFSAFADTAPVGIWTSDPNTALMTYCNEKWFQLSGQPRVPYTDIPWRDLIHEDDLDHIEQSWQAIIHAGAEITVQYRLKRSRTSINGSFAPTWIEATAYVERQSDGSIKQIVGCTNDISHLKHAEETQRLRAEALERARASETQFLRFTEIAPVGIIIIDLPTMKTTFANDMWYDLMGISSKTAATELDWVKCVCEEDVDHAKRSIANVVETRKPGNFQFRAKRLWTTSDGTSRHSWLNDYATVIVDDDGNPKALMACLTDISHLKYAESEQRLRFEEALEAKRQQENFIDMTSHEIRNPLSAVVHCADAISDSLSDMNSIIHSWDTSLQLKLGKQLEEAIGSSVEAVNTIISCAAHQKRIVDDLLTLSKLDSKLLQIHVSAIRVTVLLKDLERMFEAEAQRAGVSLTTQADSSLEALRVDWVMLDHGRTNQIVINLITNAIKFTKNEKLRKVTIRIGASRERPLDGQFGVSFALADTVSEGTHEASENDCHLWFIVQDTGRGMTKEEKAKLFRRFTQGSPKTYSEYGGSGLGLFISRELAELQGGEIGVASELGVGSTFGFFIRSHTTAPLVVPKSGTPSTLAIRGNQSGSAENEYRQVNVLICEDNLVNQRVMQKQLTKQGYKVHVADNGQEALNFLQKTRRWKGQASSEHDVHVILMDVEMPIMDGLTATKKIREYEHLGSIVGHIPIIAVSANARAEQNSQAVAVGMDDAIAKPFRIADLTPKIDRWVDWQKLNVPPG